MTNSTPAERFLETQRVYRDAFFHRRADLREAASNRDVQAVLRNLDNAELLYLRAGRSALEENGAAVEAAYAAAKTANDDVTKARECGEAIAGRIRKVSAAVKAAGDLVKKAGG